MAGSSDPLPSVRPCRDVEWDGGLNLPRTNPIWRRDFNAYAHWGGVVFLRMLVLVVWLAIAFVLPPALGRGSIGPDGEITTSTEATVAMQHVPIEPSMVGFQE